MQNTALRVAVLEADASARGEAASVGRRVSLRNEHQADATRGCWAVILADQPDPVPGAQVAGMLSWSQGSQDVLSGTGK